METEEKKLLEITSSEQGLDVDEVDCSDFH
jgi:hypothetical protein